MTAARLLLALPLLAACGGDVCDASQLSAGQAEATIDGESWSSSGAAWSLAGDAVQLTTAESDGWRLTLVASQSALGQAVGEALVDGATVEVPLGDGSFAALYPTGVAGSYAANEAGSGELLLTRTGDAVAACFDLEGTAGDGSTVSVSGGTLLAECVGDACD